MTGRITTFTPTRWATGLVILAGLWLLISPWVLGYTDVGNATTNDVVLGIVIAIIAAIRMWGSWSAAWLSWLNVVLGIWVIASPRILGYTTNNAALWDNVIFGIVVVILAGWTAITEARPTTTT